MMTFQVEYKVQFHDEEALTTTLEQLTETTGELYLLDLVRLVLEASSAVGAFYLLPAPDAKGGFYWTDDEDQANEFEDDEVVLALYTKSIKLGAPTYS